MNAQELYQSGRLSEAVAAATEDVKKRPTDSLARSFLCEMLLVSGDLDRADTHLNVLAQQDAQAAPHFAIFRHLVRAEQARRQFYDDGRLPEFIGEPTPVLKLHLQASIAAREGAKDEAARLLNEAEEQRVKPHGMCDGEPFDDLRDLDDFNASFLEVLATNGKYFWIPMEQVISLEMQPPSRPVDLIWRKASLSVAGGPDGEVYIPTIYAASYKESDERLRLGRSTMWQGEEGQPTRGLGQRSLLVGDKDMPVLEINEITVTQPGE